MTTTAKYEINRIIKDIANGDDASFENLYASMYKVLFCFLKKYCGDDEIIKDVIATTFLIVIEKSTSKLTFKNCYNWILTIAKNQLLTIIKKEKRIISIEQSNLKPYVKINDEKENLKSAIYKLNYKNRQILYLKYHEKATLKEIAQTVNLSQSTIKRRLKSTLDKLKEDITNGRF